MAGGEPPPGERGGTLVSRTWQHDARNGWSTWSSACSRPGSSSPRSGSATRCRGTSRPTGIRATDEAFKRMFERDKAELRDLGIPLETGRQQHLRHRGRLPDHPARVRAARRSSSTPAEAAAVGLAARLWQSATLGAPARTALIKLRAAGTDVAAGDAPGAVAARRRQRSGPARAARRGQAARVGAFRLPQAGRARPANDARVEPWGVLSWRRRWYVVGHDRDRGEARSFRLSRMVRRGRRQSASRARSSGPRRRPARHTSAGRWPGYPQSPGSRCTAPGRAAAPDRREPRRTACSTINYADLRWLAGIVASAGRRRGCWIRRNSSMRSSRDCARRRAAALTWPQGRVGR